jgi:chromosome segregation ATPase
MLKPFSPIGMCLTDHACTSGDAEVVAFKAVDAREREKEMSRLRAELSEMQHQAAAAQKELKRVRQQLSKQQHEAEKALQAAAAQAASASAAISAELGSKKEALAEAQRQVAEYMSEVKSLQLSLSDARTQLQKMRLDAEYLKSRATSLKHNRPRLSLAMAVNMAVSSAEAASLV